MHFMNPVPLKPMVEVIRGYHTADGRPSGPPRAPRRMGKDGIVVNDSPGFVSNRVLMLTINEADLPGPRRDGVRRATSTGSSRPASATRWARWRPPT